jgi:hypothetical protein
LIPGKLVEANCLIVDICLQAQEDQFTNLSLKSMIEQARKAF